MYMFPRAGFTLLSIIPLSDFWELGFLCTMMYLFQYSSKSSATEHSELDLRKPFAWVLQTAKLPYMRIHDLRHSFASFATDMGEDIHAIKEVLGHKYTTTTEIYTHMRDTRKIETANKVVNRIMFAQAA